MIKRLLYVSKSIIPSRSANSVHVMKMSSSFSELGIETGLVHFTEGSYDEETLFRMYDLKSPIKFFHKKWTSSWGKRQLVFFGNLYSALKAFNPELVYTRDLYAAVQAIVFRYCTVLELHKPIQSQWERWLLKWLLKNSGFIGITVISLALRDLLIEDEGIKKYSSKIIVEHDGCDYETIRSKMLDGVDATKKRIVYTGHLYKGRGIELLLEIAQALPEYEIVIVGGTPSDIERIKSVCVKQGLSNINLIGFVTQEFIPQYWNLANVLVMPYQKVVSIENKGDSSTFMSPLKMFEYLATGRPVISSDLPVLREVLKDHQNSILVRSDCADEWISAIQEVEADIELQKRLSENQLKTAAYYSWKMRANRLICFVENGSHPGQDVISH